MKDARCSIYVRVQYRLFNDFSLNDFTRVKMNHAKNKIVYKISSKPIAILNLRCYNINER